MRWTPSFVTAMPSARLSAMTSDFDMSFAPPCFFVALRTLRFGFFAAVAVDAGFFTLRRGFFTFGFVDFGFFEAGFFADVGLRFFFAPERDNAASAIAVYSAPQKNAALFRTRGENIRAPPA